MNTNKHKYYFCFHNLFGCHFRSSIREDSCSFSYGTAACLTRAVNQLVLVLFALNRKYPLND
ncbi:MAG TPA: hypothetical protein VFY40_12245, partial [Blastocatellia bacterium]|nr:hypothetical protein [Blastocatellia bacterium]